jgi:hypothetical protein
MENSWTLLTAIKREERKLEKELTKLQGKLNGVRAAAKALSTRADRESPTAIGRLGTRHDHQYSNLRVH